MKFLRPFFLVACSVWLLAGASHAATDAPNEDSLPIVATTWRAEYTLDKDGRLSENFSSVYRVQQEAALERMKKFSVSYSTSIQTGELVGAYTLKKDGRRIDAPASNYQTEVNDGRRGAGPMFSDRTVLTVVYPDLEVGDSVGVHYRIAEKEPMFPGQFSKAFTFSPYEQIEDAQIILHAPADMKLLSQAAFLQAVPVVSANGVQTLQWNYQQVKPRKWDEEADSGLWTVDEYPSLLVSTFANYEAIAQAYGARALPKAEPTARIRELAAQIVGTEKAPRERARLLYEWVSKNITYGGNCIGVGAVVPRDLDTVLDNKMGDCKDHATLLQALWSAENIASQQVLINAGNNYDLPRTPVVSMVNHVINYLPDLQLYVDATAKEVPFGLLPMETYGKPVIHVGAAQSLATIPNQQHTKQVQRLSLRMRVAEDGKAQGDMQVTLTGLHAAGARAYMRTISPQAEREFAKQALASYGYKGKGTLTKGDTSGLSDSFSYSVQFEMDNYLSHGGSTGAFVLAPVMGSPMSVMAFSGIHRMPQVQRRHHCYGLHSYETFDIDFDPAIRLNKLPPNMKRKGSIIDYSATYQRTKTGVRVAREVHDKTALSVCTPAHAAELRKQALPMAENLRTQVLYQRKTSSPAKAKP